jgi:hypothetical protein
MEERMDPVVAPGAVAPPPAAAAPVAAAVPEPPHHPLLAGSVPVPQDAPPQPTEGAPPTEGAVAPGAAASPLAGSTTTEPVQPQPQSPDQPDWQALLAQQNAELQQHRAFAAQVEQAMAQAAQMQAEAERAQAAQSRLDQAAQVAGNLAPEDGMAYIRRIYEAELAQERQDKLQTTQRMAQQYQAQAQAERELLATPVYARHLQETHGLPPEYEQRLLAYGNGRAMDMALPGLKAEWQARQADQQRIAALQAQLDQFSRSVQAQALAQSGAHVASGVGVAPVMPAGTGVEKGSDQHLTSILRAAGW